jgi:hypothetical protein
MTDYEGQFAFLFDDVSSTMIMIDKEQTEALKKKYGKVLKELIIKDPDNWWNRDSIEKRQKEAEKELQMKLQAEQMQMAESEKEFLLKQEADQKQLQKHLIREQNEQSELKEQKEQAQFEKSEKEALIKQTDAQKELQNN